VRQCNSWSMKAEISSRIRRHSGVLQIFVRLVVTAAFREIRCQLVAQEDPRPVNPRFDRRD